MKDYELLTVNDLAKRWKCEEGTIRRYVKDGTIKACNGVPKIMFNPEYIAKLEGTEINKLSPLERKRLDMEISKLRLENKRLKEQLLKVVSLGTETLNIIGVTQD